MSHTVTESIAILIIILFILFALLRSQHADYTVSVAPLLIIPFVHLIVNAAMYVAKSGTFNFRPNVVLAFADVISLAISCALFAIFSNKIKNIRTKRVYICVMVGYSIILTCAYIYQTGAF